MATAANAVPRAAGTWKLAQFSGVVLTAVLLAGLLREPELTLKILWNAVVPLLPAVFLLQPEIWRNACPLATLNVVSGRDQRVTQCSVPLRVSCGSARKSSQESDSGRG